MNKEQTSMKFYQKRFRSNFMELYWVIFSWYCNSNCATRVIL